LDSKWSDDTDDEDLDGVTPPEHDDADIGA
jgi:hypothetical protein